MEDIINRMLERINFKIRFAQENFTEWNAAHERRMAEIDGMVDMLTIVTEKNILLQKMDWKKDDSKAHTSPFKALNQRICNMYVRCIKSLNKANKQHRKRSNKQVTSGKCYLLLLLENGG